MSEFFKELLGIYKDKTRLPIVSTYIVLLIIWNWDIISIYLFSTPNMETKICWIKNIVLTKNEHFLRILIPIAIALLYPVGALLLTLLVEWLMNPVKNKIQEIQFTQRKDSASKLLQIEQERTGQKNLEQLRTELEASELNRNELVEKLKELNEFRDKQMEIAKNISNENKNFKEKYEKIKKQYDDLNMDYQEVFFQLNSDASRKVYTPTSMLSTLYQELKEKEIDFSEIIRISRNLNFFAIIEDTNFTENEFKYLLDKGIIIKYYNEHQKRQMYKLSELGRDLVNFINKKERK